jgi:hypothetical protein
VSGIRPRSRAAFDVTPDERFVVFLIQAPVPIGSAEVKVMDSLTGAILDTKPIPGQLSFGVRIVPTNQGLRVVVVTRDGTQIHDLRLEQFRTACATSNNGSPCGHFSIDVRTHGF